MSFQRIRSVGITGTGAYLPEQVITNAHFEAILDTSDAWIVSRTGIKERRRALPDETTADLGLIAARRALAKAGITPQEVDLIIVATATPDMAFPATACLIQSRLGAMQAAAFDLQAGCTGFIYGMAVGAQFIASGIYQTVLLIGAELFSRCLNWADRTTCILFGDGAGAVVLQPVAEGAGVLSVCLGADGSGAGLLELPAGGTRMPASLETVTNNLHTIHMEGSEVFKFAVRIMGEASLEALAKCGLTAGDIDMLIPHQANIRIIDAALKRLELPRGKAYVNLHRYGNMSSASIPVALDEALQEQKIKAGEHLLMVAFGAGLTWGASVVKWI
jgi:3-oxoacyl-[acyl-carrier-protein] synthase-3